MCRILAARTGNQGIFAIIVSLAIAIFLLFMTGCENKIPKDQGNHSALMPDASSSRTLLQ